MKNRLIESYSQIENAAKISASIGYSKEKIKNIIVLGMGGSAISADVFLNLFAASIPVPYSVNRDYSLPVWADRGTLVIASSYSGNTEETLSAFGQAIKKGSMIISITNGGTLGDLSTQNGLPIFGLTPCLQPRYAFYSSLFTLIRIFESLGFISDQKIFMESSAVLLQKKSIQYSQPCAEPFEKAKLISKNIPLIYSAQNFTDSVGERFKGQINENSKMMAFHKAFPEMNHNEIVGWETDLQIKKRLLPVIIFDTDYHPRVKLRFNLFSDMLAGYEIKPLLISSNEETRELRLIDIIYLCDWISYYTAIITSKDPSEIDNIDYLKRLL